MLSERKRLVLEAVIRDYVRTAEPVGSRVLARRYRLGVSPATIRNEMSDLADMGFLEQPHTSAGRVPTVRGYRYYVDHLMEAERLSADEEKAIMEQLLARRLEQLDAVFRQVSRVLSEVSRYAGVVIGPLVGRQHLRLLRLVPVEGRLAVLFLVTAEGMSQNRLISIPEDVVEEDLGVVAQILTEKLGGKALEDIGEDLASELTLSLPASNEGKRDLVRRVLELLREVGRDQVYLGGTTYILSQPEFSDVQKVQGIMRILEEPSALCQVLSGLPGDRINITIGQEHRHTEMRECSLVTAGYYLGGRPVGALGILGPTRMDYPRAVSLVQFMREQLSQALGDLDT